MWSLILAGLILVGAFVAGYGVGCVLRAIVDKLNSESPHLYVWMRWHNERGLLGCGSITRNNPEEVEESLRSIYRYDEDTWNTIVAASDIDMEESRIVEMLKSVNDKLSSSGGAELYDNRE